MFGSPPSQGFHQRYKTQAALTCGTPLSIGTTASTAQPQSPSQQPQRSALLSLHSSQTCSNTVSVADLAQSMALQQRATRSLYRTLLRVAAAIDASSNPTIRLQLMASSQAFQRVVPSLRFLFGEGTMTGLARQAFRRDAGSLDSAVNLAAAARNVLAADSLLAPDRPSWTDEPEESDEGSEESRDSDDSEDDMEKREESRQMEPSRSTLESRAIVYAAKHVLRVPLLQRRTPFIEEDLLETASKVAENADPDHVEAVVLQLFHGGRIGECDSATLHQLVRVTMALDLPHLATLTLVGYMEYTSSTERTEETLLRFPLQKAVSMSSPLLGHVAAVEHALLALWMSSWSHDAAPSPLKFTASSEEEHQRMRGEVLCSAMILFCSMRWDQLIVDTLGLIHQNYAQSSLEDYALAYAALRCSTDTEGSDIVVSCLKEANILERGAVWAMFAELVELTDLSYRDKSASIQKIKRVLRTDS